MVQLSLLTITSKLQFKYDIQFLVPFLQNVYLKDRVNKETGRDKDLPFF